MTLSAPNNPVDARRKTSRRAESRLFAVQHGHLGKLAGAAIRIGGSKMSDGAPWRAERILINLQKAFQLNIVLPEL